MSQNQNGNNGKANGTGSGANNGNNPPNFNNGNAHDLSLLNAANMSINSSLRSTQSGNGFEYGLTRAQLLEVLTKTLELIDDDDLGDDVLGLCQRPVTRASNKRARDQEQ